MCLLLKSEGGYSTNKLTVSHIFLAGHRGCCNTARTAAFGPVRATESSPGGTSNQSEEEKCHYSLQNVNSRRSESVLYS